MSNFLVTLKNRWNAKTPKFFSNIVNFGVSISGAAIAIHTAIIAAGAIEPGWWIAIYPYMIAIPAGMAACAKLTRDYNIEEQK